MTEKLWRLVRYAADGHAGEEGDGRECAHESMADGCGGCVMAEHVRRTTEFERAAQESDIDARRRMEAVGVVFLVLLMFVACIVAAVLS